MDKNLTGFQGLQLRNFAILDKMIIFNDFSSYERKLLKLNPNFDDLDPESEWHWNPIVDEEGEIVRDSHKINDPIVWEKTVLTKR